MFKKNTKIRDRKIIMGEFFGKFINFETTLKPTDTQFQHEDVFVEQND